MISLTEFRRRRDAWFRDNSASPIPQDQRANFTGLNYYPENRALRFTLALQDTAPKDAVKLITSTGETQDFLRWGRIHFHIEGQPAALVVYYSSWGAYFVPFIDATSGNETYSAGRYLELHELDDGRFFVDFNLAYHPYCVYSAEYSCPLPPAENHLTAPIRAGERL